MALVTLIEPARVAKELKIKFTPDYLQITAHVQQDFMIMVQPIANNVLWDAVHVIKQNV